MRSPPRLPGRRAENIHGRTHVFHLDNYSAYFCRVRRRLEETLAAGAPPDTYPEPVEHCRVAVGGRSAWTAVPLIGLGERSTFEAHRELL